MAIVRTFVCLGVCMCASIISAQDQNSKAENVRWTSLDFKTMVTWTTKSPEHTYTVRYSGDGGDWEEADHCFQIQETHCDLTEDLKFLKSTYTADILTDSENQDYSPEEFQHTKSQPFNPYKESNISAVEFSVLAVDEKTVRINITDTLTSIHKGMKQLTIRDIFNTDLKYKIMYYKSESTRQKVHESENNVTEVSNLDSATSYCFMVAAYIPTRPKASQLGAWSKQLCEDTHGSRSSVDELSLGAWVSVIFVLLAVIIIVVTVTVLCCRNKRQRPRTTQQTPQSQSSVPV